MPTWIKREIENEDGTEHTVEFSVETDEHGESFVHPEFCDVHPKEKCECASGLEDEIIAEWIEAYNDERAEDAFYAAKEAQDDFDDWL